MENNNIKQASFYLILTLVLTLVSSLAANLLFVNRGFRVDLQAKNLAATKELSETREKNTNEEPETVEAQTSGCTNYVIHQDNCAAFCAAGEKLVIGGCGSNFLDMDELPVVSSQPTVSVEVDPNDARPGWKCSYEVRRDKFFGTTTWYGGYCMQTYVMCCS